jgi:hypothetical protein
MEKRYLTQAISEVNQSTNMLTTKYNSELLIFFPKAEPWWVDYLSRHPVLIPYTTGINRLDKIYLDTTFVAQKEKHQLFSPKSYGIRELIERVGKYPQDTIFHFNTWTFGYEDVWVALAAAFNAKVSTCISSLNLTHTPLPLYRFILVTTISGYSILYGVPKYTPTAPILKVTSLETQKLQAA